MVFTVITKKGACQGSLFSNQRWLTAAAGSAAGAGYFRAVFTVLRRETPVGELFDEDFQEVRAAVLEVEIIGVLPHIADEQRCFAIRQRRFSVRRFDDFQLALIGNQPDPSRAKLTDAGGDKLFLEFIKAAEGFVDFFEQR